MVLSSHATRLTSFWTCPRCRAFAAASKRRASGAADPQGRRTAQRLPSYPARTRFAPSPTGYLHLGSLRTALFNYLLAKATGGQFLLRVEDTDQKRTVADAEDRLYDDLRWAGLQWDEGPDVGGPYGPYKQSERTSLYRKHAQLLITSGHAYRCFCSLEREAGFETKHGGSCSTITPQMSEEYASRDLSHVVRLRMPEPEPSYTDLVYGKVRGPPRAKKRFGLECHDGPVLLKSDGFPTYHLANVVDDHHMKITHVIRGAEWMSSTPKHMVMYEAFGWQPPAFSHVGLLQNQERQKYSKRKGDADLDMASLEKKGVFPEALVNYVALHGWSHNFGDDFLRLPDLIHKFDLKFTKGNTIIKPTKLDYLQKRYAEIYAKDEGPLFKDMVERTLVEVKAIPHDHDLGYLDSALICSEDELRLRVTALLRLDARKYTFPQAFSHRLSYFFYSKSHDQLDPRLEPLRDHLGEIENCFSTISSEQWDTYELSEAMSHLGGTIDKARNGESATEESRRTSFAQVQNFLRWAISYGHSGPGMAHTMELLGRIVTLERIKFATEMLARQATVQD